MPVPKPQAMSELILRAGSSSRSTEGTPHRVFAALAAFSRLRKKMIPAFGLMPIVNSAPAT
jgi:hypothetical protein